MWSGAGVLLLAVLAVVLLLRRPGAPEQPQPVPPKDHDSPHASSTNPTGLRIIPETPLPPDVPLEFGKPIFLKGHRQGSIVVDLAYSPDGSKLASMSDKGEVILWNLVAREGVVVARDLRRESSGPAQLGAGKRLAFSPDGKTLFSGCAGEATAWNTETTYARAKFGQFHQQTDDLVVSSDGTTVVAERAADEEGDNRNGIVIWDAASSQTLFKIDFNKLAINNVVRCSPDGRYVALCEWPPQSTDPEDQPTEEELANSKIRLFDVRSGKELPAIRVAAVDALMLPGNRLLTWEIAAGTVMKRGFSLWTISTDGNAPRQQAIDHLLRPSSSPKRKTGPGAPRSDDWDNRRLSPDGKLLAYMLYEWTGGTPQAPEFDTLLVVRETANLEANPRVVVRHPSGVHVAAFCFGADAKSVLVMRRASKTYDRAFDVAEFDLGAGKQQAAATIPLDSDPEKRGNPLHPVMAVTAARPNTVAVALPEGVILIQPLGVKPPAAPRSWEITAKSTEVKSGAVQLVTTAPRGLIAPQPKEVASFPLSFRYDRDETTTPLAISPDGRLVVAGGTLHDDQEGLACVFDLRARKEHATIKTGVLNPPGDGLRFSPDQRFLVDDNFNVLDLEKGEAVPRPDDLGGNFIELVPGGERVLIGVKHQAGDVAGVVQFRSLPALARERSALESFEGNLLAARYSADGSQLAAVLSQRDSVKVMLLDPKTGESRKVLSTSDDDRSDAAELAFSPDGKTLAVSTGGTTAEWKLSVYDLEAGKRRLLLPGMTEPYSLANGRLVGAPKVYDAVTGQLRVAIDPGDVYDGSRVDHLCPRCNLMASGHVNGRVTLWELTRGVMVADFEAHKGPVLGVTLSRDGRTLVTAGKENRLKVWALGN